MRWPTEQAPTPSTLSANPPFLPRVFLLAFVTAPTQATVRAWGFSGAGCIDAAALEAALQHTVTDVPALGGRLGGMSCLRLGTLRVEHTGAGALFTAADCRSSSATLAAAMGADEWPQEGVTAQDLKLPFYVSCMDTGRRCGAEPTQEGQCDLRESFAEGPREASLPPLLAGTHPMSHFPLPPCPPPAGCWLARSPCSMCG